MSREDLSREHQLDRIVREFLERVDRGEKVDRDELIRRHPDLAPDLAEFIDDYGELEWLRHVHRPDEELSLGVGERLGDYEILEEIGRGGMGVVFKARQTSLDRVVAVKVVRGGQLASDEERRRFEVEAKAAAQLDHPNIVAIHDVGEADAMPFFSMQLVEGSSVAVSSDDLRDDPRAAAEFLETVARAVHHAHERGVLHRDLKPGNLLRTGRGVLSSPTSGSRSSTPTREA